ncbi:MAG: hypothetical protein JAY85_10875 [Candidatus Thiodiazotropha weberae]|uniref:DNA primase/polymerase bifunctional N-terminal domain-containing protein n=1 Tax=Candidatus Thiodiazotropha endoloripes TaxID=1818881 RepID=A0A1E2UNS0_9GAMM|nr:hypothetical protein [Candidatus Thiodiazotropha endoloripes]MCG7898948.1 hypothetical protein [Candidatus Thiodiazotropha weberae]ODB96400.1 hypothetical protein A3196_06295 [Candidatus Thiodiazotropha endoloripes]
MTDDRSAVSPSAATDGQDLKSPVAGQTNNSTYAALPLNPDDIPEALKALRRFVVFRLAKKESKPGKRDKVPYQPEHPSRKASTREPSTWSTFDKAIEVYSTDRADGIGFVLTDIKTLIAIDLDNCIDTNGKLSETASEIVGALPGYWEISPSGRGLHGIFEGSLPGPDIADNDSGVEMYGGGSARFITLTGHLWCGT